MNASKQKELIKPLFYFRTVVDCGSFTKASAMLGMAEPNLWREIHKLELSLDKKLLSKSSCGMTPTHEGLKIYPYIEQIDILFKNLENSISDDHDISGDITVSLTDGIGIYIIPQLMDFYKQYPQVNLRFISASSEADIKNRKVDIAITYQYPRITKSMIIKQYSREFGLFASTSFINKFGMPKNETDMLENYEFCNRFEYCENWEQWRNFTAQTKNKVTEFDSSNLLIQATDNGLGIALHPLKYGLNRPNWVFIDSGMSFRSPYWVLSHYDDQNSNKIQTMLAFIDDLAKHI